MQYRRLGRSGLQVSAIGLGSQLTFGTRLDFEATRRCVAAAVDAGINLFDTADGYGDGEAERLLGRALAEHRRAGWAVATECFFPRSEHPSDRGLSRKHVVESVHGSLRRLRVDHIDLMQCHRFDPETPLEETIGALDDLVRQGKVLYWGVGRCSPGQLGAYAGTAQRMGARAPVSHQTLYNLLHREIEAEILPAAERAGIGTIGYAPLAAGVLSGKYAGGAIPGASRAAAGELRAGMYDLTPDKVEIATRVGEIAAEAGLKPATLALAWCLRDPRVACVLAGASRLEQIADNAAAAAITLDAGIVRRLDEATA